MKIAVAQLNSNDNLQGNLNQIKKIIMDSVKEKPEVVFFPENSLYFRINANTDIEAIDIGHPAIIQLEALCKQTGIAAHLTTAIKENDKVYNASFLIDKNGQTKIIYRKIHLFDIELTGQKAIRESDCFAYGAEASIFNISDFKVGSSICYDVRFSELYSIYSKAEVDIIVVPAAFLVKTGQAHWETLLRARAIESQCYVVASAQSGEHTSVSSDHKRETYGHTMVVDPWGRVISMLQTGTGVAFAELNFDEIRSVRQQIPMKNHRIHRKIDL
ncbi:carbon-nitrogen hydrolase family protein [bacterium]|nr:carbon-nitrogen hydrolase family protein [bacterium]